MKKLMVAALITAACLTGCGTAAPAQTVQPEPAVSAAAAPVASQVPIVVSTADMSDQYTVRTSATVTKQLEPDMAEISFYVETHNMDADKCRKENSDTANALIDAAKAKGIDEKDIQTSDVSLRQDEHYDYDTDTRIYGEYVMRTSVKISSIPIDNAGDIIGACVVNNKVSMGGMQFTCSNYDDAYAEALAEATAETKTKAESMASAIGYSLGAPVSIEERYQDTSAKYLRGVSAMAEAADNSTSDAAISPAIAGGTLEITANVSATYQVK
jgi:hypothetical protein